jgi:hypothetical protein
MDYKIKIDELGGKGGIWREGRTNDFFVLGACGQFFRFVGFDGEINERD